MALLFNIGVSQLERLGKKRIVQEKCWKKRWGDMLGYLRMAGDTESAVVSDTSSNEELWQMLIKC